MSTIKKLEEKDFKAFTELQANAYPFVKVNTPEEKQRMEERYLALSKSDPTAAFYGLFRDDKMLGCMRYYDFDMRLLSTKTFVGGLGAVAVDLLHKKEKVAKEIVMHFIEHYKKNDAAMVMLYPFRPDFYKKMGFGFGTKMNQFRIKPSDLPSKSGKSNIFFYEEKDKQGVIDCYNRMMAKTHGMVEMTVYQFDGIMGRPENKLVLYKEGELVKGYIIFNFAEAANTVNVLSNDINIKQFIYENSSALMELMAFLNTQSDQINRVIFNTLDENFHHILSDPRDHSNSLFTPVYHQSNIQGVGLMYRVVSLKRLFEVLSGHNFNNQTCNLRISVTDSFLPSNEGGLVVHFINGRPRIVDEDDDYEVEICMDIADFSSLIMGAVSFKALAGYGQAEISDEKYIDIVTKIFRTDEKPVCTTNF